ncbi:9749_t:CDS:1, partial [Acaulospora morrowiae]
PSTESVFIVLEHVNGIDLRTYLETNFLKLDWDVKIRIAKGIAEGLNYIHHANVIHCNL